MTPRAPGVVVAAVMTIGLACPTRARAQSPAELLGAARTQIENLNVDSANILLDRIQNPSLRASPTERALARVLSGAGALISRREARAQALFREALVLDPLVRVDTLTSLHSDLARVFEAARAGPATLVAAVPADTVVPADSGVLRILVRTSRRVTVRLTILSPDSPAPIYRDTLTVGGAAALGWRPDASALSAGSLTLRVAVDDGGAEGAAFTTPLRVEPVRADTVPWPPLVNATELLPEREAARTRGLRPLLTGVVFAAAAAAITTWGAEGPSGRDARGVVVGAALTTGGIIGFLHGAFGTRAIPENIVRNRAAVAANGAARDSVAHENLRRRAAAGIRIVTDPSAP